MAHIELPYVQRFTDRNGHQRHYFRRRGHPRAVLPGLPGSTDFMAAYAAAMGQAQPAIGASRTGTGTVSDLCVRYYQSAAFHQLASSTQRTYRNLIENSLRVEHGDKPWARLEGRHIRGWMDAKASTPAAANALLKLLRILARFAIERGFRKDDPTAGIRKLRSRTEGFHDWTETELATFEARWAPGTRERLAYALLLFTAQRRSDVIRMGRQHVRDGEMRVVQKKTGARLTLPVHPDLLAVLDVTPAEHLTFLTTDQGKPFSDAGFGNWFRDVCDGAGLKHCAAHGLRKAAARRLAEAGCTAHQIAAMTGHKSLREVALYTAAADQVRLAREAGKMMGGRALK